MVKVSFRDGSTKEFPTATMAGMHASGKFLGISNVKDAGTGFREEYQVAVIPYDVVQYAEVEGGPKIMQTGN